MPIHVCSPFPPPLLSSSGDWERFLLVPGLSCSLATWLLVSQAQWQSSSHECEPLSVPRVTMDNFGPSRFQKLRRKLGVASGFDQAMDEEEERGAVLHEAAAAFIAPPRLEDAGLEDCALPPESIMEAFALAAISVGPRVDEDGDDEGFGEAPDEDSASGAPSAAVAGGGVGIVASDGLAVLGGYDSDSDERKTAKEFEDEEKEEFSR
ncbi:hypothetical protein B296_00056964 [Ensete ventricosum]|uniref:Uncharacterized protein n=1 Tax=Ensete ventricosum TaxID=4639 RepID=A0A426X4Y3_ENSVE|nr:hypothetical protein B296_00056964 [Ensete ventricosum]